MSNCDMCGKEGELVEAIVEGSMMNVCLFCSRHGSVVTINQAVVEKKIEREREEEEGISQYVDVIVDNFAERIKKAREKKGLRQEDLAKAIAEKESVINQLETGRLKPSSKLAKKLAVFLNITLVENVEQKIPKKGRPLDFKDESVTIGDLLRKR